MAVKYKLNLQVMEDDSIEAKVENPGGLTPWAIIGILEKLKTEVVLSMPGPEERSEEKNDG